MDWCLGDAAQHYSSLQEHFPGDNSAERAKLNEHGHFSAHTHPCESNMLQTLSLP